MLYNETLKCFPDLYLDGDKHSDDDKDQDYSTHYDLHMELRQVDDDGSVLFLHEQAKVGQVVTLADCPAPVGLHHVASRT